MREIKFRGYDQENKVWRYGYYTRLQSGCRLYNAIIVDDETAEERLTAYYIHDRTTIGQFTGRKDKNGKEIYEGDKVKVTCEWYGVFIVPVSFENGAFGYRTFDAKHVENPKRWERETHNCIDSYGFVTSAFEPFNDIHKKDYVYEIIGNIHQEQSP